MVNMACNQAACSGSACLQQGRHALLLDLLLHAQQDGLDLLGPTLHRLQPALNAAGARLNACGPPAGRAELLLGRAGQCHTD